MAGAERLILPLDVGSLDEAREIINEVGLAVGVYKVGLELFTAAGPDAVRLVHDLGAECFLDLKIHDIPRTVGKAAESAVRLGVRYLTVHTSSGRRAMAAAYQATQGSDTRILGVTVLTSMEEADLSEVGITEHTQSLVARRAELAITSGINGLVCAASECAAIREAHGLAPLLVVPGVRPEGSPQGDQRRVATPAAAMLAGASMLVVGRPILNAPDRKVAAEEIGLEIARAVS